MCKDGQWIPVHRPMAMSGEGWKAWVWFSKDGSGVLGMATMTSTGPEMDMKPLAPGLPACIPELLPEPLTRGAVMNEYQEERGNLHFKCGDETVVLNSLAVTHPF